MKADSSDVNRGHTVKRKPGLSAGQVKRLLGGMRASAHSCQGWAGSLPTLSPNLGHESGFAGDPQGSWRPRRRGLALLSMGDA